MELVAHVRYDGNGCIVQTVAEHSRGSARYAALAAIDGLKQTAFLAALLHDMGKCTAAFYDYIHRAARKEPVRRGSVNHTFAAVRFVMERWHNKGKGLMHDLTCELIACAMGGHHGLFDALGPQGIDGLAHRLDTEGIFYEEARDAFLARCVPARELDTLFDQAVDEVSAIFARCKAQANTEQELHFLLSMLQRLLLSLVIEGDRRDTAEFALAVSPTSGDSAPPPWQGLLRTVEAHLAGMPADSDINRARHAISDACRRAAHLPRGIYRLCVPTGGGKTLASLRYALAAAQEGGQQRIIFAVPLLSVLEQNAKVIRDCLGRDDLILEHHSNVVQAYDGQDELHENQLLQDSWSAPVLITTLVQLLNTLLDGKTSAIRRLQALQDSIVVIDEVQSVPLHMLTLFNLALNFLSGVCGATFVLCSATQPSLEHADHPIRYREPADLAPYDPALWQVFKRTEIINCHRHQGYTAEEIALMALERIEQYRSALVICNTKAQARDIFSHAKQSGTGAGGGVAAFHLSTAMCMAHRIATLQAICDHLERGERVLCVSTQLVEAGVDISFGCVIRLLAGLDNVIQAAGRCNRNGELGPQRPVYIVNLRGEDLARLPVIASAQRAAGDILARFGRDAAPYGHDLASQSAVSAYYQKLYSAMPARGQDFSVVVPVDVKSSLYSLLSDNQALLRKGQRRVGYVFSQAFRTAGEAFRVFDDNTYDILVPYGRGICIINKLGSDSAKHSLDLRAQLLDAAKGYTISVYGYMLNRLKELGGVYPVCDGMALALMPGLYLENVGCAPELYKGDSRFLEVRDES